MTLASGFARPSLKRPEQDRVAPGRHNLDIGALDTAALVTGALKWRVLIDTPASGVRNMAVDHALAACLNPGEAVLRIYEWSGPTASFGRNEPARDRYDPAAGCNAGIEFVRRPTGGRAVLHDRELTYAVVLPITPLRTKGGLKATYRLIHKGLVEALCFLGVPAAMAEDRGSLAGLDAGPCFDRPAPGEVTVAGRKLVGSAQARLNGAILQHGSLLIGPGQDRLLGLVSTPAESPAGGNVMMLDQDVRLQAPISLEEVLGHEPSWSHLVEAVIKGVSGVAGGDWHRGELTEPERVKAREFALRYASAEWTWRR